MACIKLLNKQKNLAALKFGLLWLVFRCFKNLKDKFFMQSFQSYIILPPTVENEIVQAPDRAFNCPTC